MRRRNKIFSSPNGFKIFKVPMPWAFAFGLDSREFSTTHGFEGATIKVDCVAFSRLDISEDVDEIVGKLEQLGFIFSVSACAIFENLGRVQSRVRWHRRSRRM